MRPVFKRHLHYLRIVLEIPHIHSMSGNMYSLYATLSAIQNKYQEHILKCTGDQREQRRLYKTNHLGKDQTLLSAMLWLRQPNRTIVLKLVFKYQETSNKVNNNVSSMHIKLIIPHQSEKPIATRCPHKAPFLNIEWSIRIPFFHTLPSIFISKLISSNYHTNTILTP